MMRKLDDDTFIIGVNDYKKLVEERNEALRQVRAYKQNLEEIREIIDQMSNYIQMPAQMALLRPLTTELAPAPKFDAPKVS